MKKQLKIFGHEALIRRVTESGKTVTPAKTDPKSVLLEAEDFIIAAAQENPEICPRCGNSLDERPALSRRVSVSICSDCGTQEALCDAIGQGYLDTIQKWIAWEN